MLTEGINTAGGAGNDDPNHPGYSTVNPGPNRPSSHP
jgi:hypothetical protein